MKLNEIKLTKKNIIIAILSFITFYIIAILLTVFLKIEMEKSSWREHNIKSFAGCFNEGKTSWKSYENMSEQEFEESLKQLDISKKEFEKRKDRCIKQSQISSFAGCKKSEHKWKMWNEMNEQEFKDSLKYFDIDKKFFDYMKNGCENGNWE